MTQQENTPRRMGDLGPLRIRHLGDTTRAKLETLLGGIFKQDGKGSFVIDEDAPAIKEEILHAKTHGVDAVIHVAKDIVIRCGHYAADHPNYVDAAKAGALLASGAAMGVIGVVLYKHARPDKPPKS